MNSREENDEHDREYGCKYCDRKFTNKQALGGHQNAHKVERAVDKGTNENQTMNFGYTTSTALSSSYRGTVNPGPLLGYYSRSHEFVARGIPRNHYPYPQPSYGVRQRPISGHGHPGWTSPQYYMHSPSYHYPAFRANGSSHSQFPIAHQPFPGSSIRPGVNREDNDDSGLDLSLKL